MLLLDHEHFVVTTVCDVTDNAWLASFLVYIHMTVALEFIAGLPSKFEVCSGSNTRDEDCVEHTASQTALHAHPLDTSDKEPTPALLSIYVMPKLKSTH